jgi:hypothetical protein
MLFPGYHLLLEKPMAVDEADCEEIARVCSEAGVVVAVCHVLRSRFYLNIFGRNFRTKLKNGPLKVYEYRLLWLFGAAKSMNCVKI